ncbi:MAG: hypothetical protein U0401_24240 [Anaerolineae bacterium]
MNTKVRIVFVTILGSVLLTNCLTPTGWIRFESSFNRLSIKYPNTLKLAGEQGRAISFGQGTIQLSGQGEIVEPAILIVVHDKNSSELQPPYLPANIDLSDPLAVVIAQREFDFKSVEHDIQELEAPKRMTFNGYSGAMTLISQTYRKEGLPQKNLIYCLVTIVDETRVIKVRGFAHRENGGLLLSSFMEEFLSTLELQ